MAMDSITVEIPETLRAYVEGRIQSSGYGNANEYLLDLIQLDQKSQESIKPYTSGAEIEGLLVEGLESGDAGLMTDEDWAELRRPYENR
jgi:antitoxin ParD1/3/4